MIAGVPLLEDLADLAGKRVLVRLDFNVPLTETPDGDRVVADDFRIRAALPTSAWLLDHGPHHGLHPPRPPQGQVETRPTSLASGQVRLDELIPASSCWRTCASSRARRRTTRPSCSSSSKGHDAYVNDAFGVSHRAHASVVGPPAYLPSAAGRLLAREVEVLTGLLETPARPFVAVVGGAKVTDKLGVLRSLAAQSRHRARRWRNGLHASSARSATRSGTRCSIRAGWTSCSELLRSAGHLMVPVDTRALGSGPKAQRRAPWRV